MFKGSCSGLVFLESLLHPGVAAYWLSMLTHMFEISLALLTAPADSKRPLVMTSVFIHRASAPYYLHNILGQTFFLNSTVHSDTYCSVSLHFVLHLYPCSRLSGSSYTTHPSSNVLRTFWHDAAGSSLFTVLEKERRKRLLRWFANVSGW